LKITGKVDKEGKKAQNFLHKNGWLKVSLQLRERKKTSTQGTPGGGR